MIGSIIQNYKIYSILGEGGMGVVYKAFDVKLERYVALKILNNHAVLNSQFVERFRREAKNQAKLNHPNIVPVFEFTEDKNVMGIAMEYVDGESLEQMINRKGKLELGEALGILQQILTGISYAHKKGFIHRDIKPSNVIINREGIAKIMDFGISKSLNEISITKTGAKVGTIMYMSPEQVRAEEPTVQSDIYSIGVSFYEMLAGKPPFDYKTEFEILEAHLKKIPQKITASRTDIPPEIDIIIAKALEKNIHNRYYDCEEFLEDINRLIRILNSAQGAKKENKIKLKKKRVNWTSVVIASVSFILFVVFGMIAYNIVAKVWDVKFNMGKLKDTALKDYPGLQSNPNYYGRQTWHSLETNTRQNINAVAFLDDSLGFACGDSGTVIKTTNGGNSWQNINVNAENTNLYDIKFSKEGRGYLIGKNGLLLISEDKGDNWKPQIFLEPPKFCKIYIKNDLIFLLAYNGLLLRCTNSNENIVFKAPNYTFYGIAFSDEQTGFLTTKEGAVFKTTDKGRTWNQIQSYTDNYIRDLDFATSSIGISVGGSDVFRTNDGGNNWEKIKYEKLGSLVSIKYLENSRWLAVTYNGILKTEDNGELWEEMPAVKASYTSILKYNRSVYITGSVGTILKWSR